MSQRDGDQSVEITVCPAECISVKKKAVQLLDGLVRRQHHSGSPTHVGGEGSCALTVPPQLMDANLKSSSVERWDL